MHGGWLEETTEVEPSREMAKEEADWMALQQDELAEGASAETMEDQSPALTAGNQTPVHSQDFVKVHTPLSWPQKKEKKRRHSYSDLI